jgi:tetratricopeptide (TPR) repeat protein
MVMAGVLWAAVAQGQTARPLPAGPSSAHAADPEALFHAGEAELRAGDLAAAEQNFRAVLALNPQVAGAYANLGVIYMRRRQWAPALESLQKAEKLSPSLAGVRLNIGIVHYRQNDFQGAIAPFTSVVRDQPDSFQARYLLGLCYFLTEQYESAVSTLEPLWPQASGEFNYLYIVTIAAGKAGRHDLEQLAQNRLVEVGQNNPAFHLLMGKAHINREEYDQAIHELELAAQGDPKLPYLHFNLGMAYLKKRDLLKAEAEFQREIALEPDVAESYDQLGLVY